MKSVERHKLETNTLAHGLEVYIERYKPYFAKVAWGVLAVVALLFIWSYVSGSSTSRQNVAWDAYNEAVGSQPMNLDQLRRTAEEYPGTKMQQMADVAWADGQVMMGANSYIYNRTAANEALNKATSAYQGVLKSTEDERLAGRARLGLARVYEMQNELEKARNEYAQVTGSYAKYAKAQAERLAKPEAAETYAWLATAQPPRPVAPMGPGTPGQKPEFSPGDISLPNSGAANPGSPETGADSKAASETFDSLLKEMQKQSQANDKEGDRYKTDQPAAKDATPADDKNDAAPPPGDAAKTPPAAPAAPAEKSPK